MIDWLFFTTFHAVRIAESEEDEGNKTKIYDILHLVQILSTNGYSSYLPYAPRKSLNSKHTTREKYLHKKKTHFHFAETLDGDDLDLSR